MSFSYESVPMVLQEFGALQTSLLKHICRLKQRDSLPLNAARWAGGSEVPPVCSRGKAPVGSLEDEVPRKLQKLKLFAHLHTLFCSFALCALFGSRRRSVSRPRYDL